MLKFHHFQQLKMCVSVIITFGMQGPLLPSHAAALVSLAASTARDCVLVSSCGARLEVPGILLALHSPLLAPLLGQGQKGVSLPLSLQVVRGLLSLLEGGEIKEWIRKEIKEAAALIGITEVLQGRTRDVKLEIHTMVKKHMEIKHDMGEEGVHLKNNIAMQEEGELLDINGDQKRGSNSYPYFKADNLKMMAAEVLGNTSSDAMTTGNENSENEYPNNKSKPATQTNRQIKKKKYKSYNQSNKSKITGKFPCDLCSFCYESKFGLMKHKNTDHNVLYKCEECFLEFLEGVAYKCHIKKNHPTYVCSTCGVKKSSTSHLNQHIESKHLDDIQCPNCKLIYKTQYALNHHIKRHHSIKKYEKCIKCDYETHMRLDMKYHFKHMHTKTAKEICYYCGQKFRQLRTHLRRTGCRGKSKKKDWPCKQCDGIFSQRNELKYHVTEHMNTRREINKEKLLKSKTFPCKVCDTSYSKSFFLLKHMKQKHGTPFQCEKCNQVFPEETVFKNHITNNHPAFVCTICGVAKFHKSKLDFHMESKHQEGRKCPHCEIICITEKKLKGHIDRLHSTKELIKCIKCDYKTHTQSEVNAHFKKRHTEECKKACHSCGQVFKALKDHLKRTKCGGNEKLKMPCAQCNKIFTHEEGLRKHVKEIHVGLKDKKCPQCSYATYSGYNLRLHITKTHLGKAMVKEACPHCDIFTTNLNYHINIMHNEQFVANSTNLPFST